jgi:hypothetical protein
MSSSSLLRKSKIAQAGPPWLSTTRSAKCWCIRQSIQEEGIIARTKLAIELGNRWGIWPGGEICELWGQQKTAVKSEQAGWGCQGGVAKGGVG